MHALQSVSPTHEAELTSSCEKADSLQKTMQPTFPTGRSSAATVRSRSGGVIATDENLDPAVESVEQLVMVSEEAAIDLIKEREDLLSSKFERSIYQARETNILTSEQERVLLIEQPTASKMSYQDAHPMIYRTLEAVRSTDELAELLQAPKNWRKRLAKATAGENNIILTKLRTLATLPGLYENPASNAMKSVFLAMGYGLRLPDFDLWDQEDKTIGGVLSHHVLDYCGRTDIHVVVNGISRLALEQKTETSWRDSDLYYQGSRLIQLLLHMYGHGCPAMLATNKKFKLIFENRQRNRIFTFPYGDSSDNEYLNSCAIGRVDRGSFLEVLAILMMSARVVLPPSTQVDAEGTPVTAASWKQGTDVGKPLKGTHPIVSKTIDQHGESHEDPTTPTPSRRHLHVPSFPAICPLTNKLVQVSVRVYSDDVASAIAHELVEAEIQRDLEAERAQAVNTPPLHREGVLIQAQQEKQMPLSTSADTLIDEPEPKK